MILNGDWQVLQLMGKSLPTLGEDGEKLQVALPGERLHAEQRK